MLTGKSISTQRASEYFVQGHYKQKKGSSRWFGKGANKLGLSGAVDDEDVFNHLTNGYSPDGETQLSARSIDTFERRAASDLTFSAPKSVSLTALVGGDKRLFIAHQISVEKTLTLIEQRYAHTRVTIDSNRQVISTNNLVVAEFDHIESRELDPHLHTHCLIMNMTFVEEGQWYSHHNDAIYNHKKYLGMIYQSFLAIEVQKLGYSIEKRKHGQFEIKGYSNLNRLNFSKRRQQILAAAGTDSSWSDREKYWASTRKRKEKVDPDQLKLSWQQEALDLGITIVQPQPSQNWQPVVVQKHHLDDAIAHCSLKKVEFSIEDIEKFILEQNLATDLSGLDSLIGENTELEAVRHRGKNYFTTGKALRLEAETRAFMLTGQERVSFIAHPEIVKERLSATALNEGQRQAVELASTTRDQFVAWQGVAGAGKTFALKEFQTIAQENGYTVKAFAPSSQAAKVLGHELGIQGETVASLLVSKRVLGTGDWGLGTGQDNSWMPSPQHASHDTQSPLTNPQSPIPKQIWIVDEAGLLSAASAHQLLERATNEQARVILVGDTRQLSAVEAGNPFKSLQEAGIKTAYLNESLRQRTPQLKLVVDLIVDHEIEQSFERLQDYGYIQTVTQEEKIQAIATEYMSAAAPERAKTLVLAGTNEMRLALTLAIRDQMKAEGTLAQETTTTQLKAKALTVVQMQYTHNFNIGDIVIPTRSYKRLGLEKGQQYTVVGKNRDALALEDSNGQQLEVDTKFYKSVYQPQQIAISVGDRLKWTKNDRLNGRRNGQEFVVKAIDGRSATIEYVEDSHTETINLSCAQHFDYAIVSTVHSSQGKTADRVLVAADQTLFKENFYVAVSRAKYDIKLYTESPQLMLERALTSKAKLNPSDLSTGEPLEAVASQTVTRTESVQHSESTFTTPNYEPSHHDDITHPVKKSITVARTQPVQHSESTLTTPTDESSYYDDITHPVGKPTIAVVTQPSSSLPKTPPEWLTPGKRVFYNQTWGEVQSIKGNSLFINLDTGENKHIIQWQDAIDSQTIIPEPTEAFWVKDRTYEAPAHIEPQHWHELVHDSVIHPDIAAANFKSLQLDPIEQEHEAWAHLMYSDKLERSNTGRLTTGMLKKYAHIDAGGWWCDAGVDPRSFQTLQPGEKPSTKIWGCFKPKQPRENPDKPGKKIKYEHPPKTDLSIFLLDVPHEIANRIYSKHKVNPTQEERKSGFWYCVHKYNLPITITEGAKKAASLLSQGHAAIGLPGIYAGYRSNRALREKNGQASYLECSDSSINGKVYKPAHFFREQIGKDEQGNEIEARLHDELAIFATPKRDIKISFDYETKPETKRNIDIATFRTGSLLENFGAVVSVVTLPGPDKGVDDLIAAQGGLAYEKLSLEAKPLKEWLEYNRTQPRLLPKPILKQAIEDRFDLNGKLEPLNIQTSSSAILNTQAAGSSSQSLEQEQEAVFASTNYPTTEDKQIINVSTNSEAEFDPEINKPTNNLTTSTGEKLSEQQITSSSSAQSTDNLELDAETLSQQLSQNSSPTSTSVISHAEEYDQEILQTINQMNDHDLINFANKVSRYFHTIASQPPSQIDKDNILCEIDKLSQHINDLWIIHEQLQKQILSMQYNPLRMFGRKYSDLQTQSLATLDSLSQTVAQKEQFEQQLTNWEQHHKEHLAWQTSPDTEQMKKTAQVLELPQIQQRLTAAKDAISRQRQQELPGQEQSRLKQQQQQRPLRRRGRGR